MTDLPKGWTEVALGDVCEIRIGKTPPRADSSSWEGGDLPWLSIADMDQGRDLWHTKEKITTSAVERYNCRLVEPGTLLLSFKLSIGKLGFARIPLFTNEAIAHLPVSTEALLPEYLYRALQAAPLSRGSDRAVLGKTLNKSKLAGIRLPLPPLEEQRRIAAILDKADELRAKRRAALEQLDTLTQAIFLDMFGDPAANSRGWPLVQIGEVTASAAYGTAQKASGEGAVPVLRMGNLTVTGAIDATDLKFLDHADEKHLLRPGDVLFNRTNSAELVGKTAVFRLPGEWAYAGYLVRLRLTDEAAPDFVGTFMNLPSTKQRLRSMCKAIVGQANINAKELQRIPMPLPPRALQDDFVRRLDAVERAKDPASAGESSLDVLFDSLQSRAFRGEL